jgi:thiaminase/transcriptional activator TenA
VTSGSLSERLRASCAAVWDALPVHPFVRELADGTLPAEKFRFYLEQNLLYLPEYARAIAFGAARAGDEAELKNFSAALANIVETEIPENRAMLEAVIAAGAPDRGGSLGAAPGTMAYTSYLIASAFRGGPLEVMAAVLPCAWSYGEIGASLADASMEHPIYGRWIGFFASVEYAEVVGRMRTEMDLMASGGADEAQLAETFRMGTRLELVFWQMAYELAQWPDLKVTAART